MQIVALNSRINLEGVVSAVVGNAGRSHFRERSIESLSEVALLKLLVLLEDVMIDFVQVLAWLLHAAYELLNSIRIVYH